ILGCIDENLLEARQIAFPSLRKHYPAGTAIEQARTQVRFQLGHRAGSIGRRDAYALSGTGEAALLRHTDKDSHHLQRV
ncbi:hypothetical protein QSI21_24010, partial [Enterobacter hormaechei]